MSSSGRQADTNGNTIAREGCDRCECGNKYWENDKCVDCGFDIFSLRSGYAHKVGLTLDECLFIMANPAFAN